jgi:hypothetical protein
VALTSTVSFIFALFALLLAAFVVVGLSTVFKGRSRVIAVAAFLAWLLYASVFSASGLLANTALRPPAPLLLVTPIVVFLALAIGRSTAGTGLARFPAWLLIGFQTFRLGVEWTISALHDSGLAPRIMTLPGGNFEILIALSAPLAAFVSTRGEAGRRAALLWTILGIVSLGNVAARAIFSAPGPLHLIPTELPNLAFAHFPFGLIPGFMAPLALATQVLALRALLRAGRAPVAATLSV